jgi:hypothetical protein
LQEQIEQLRAQQGQYQELLATLHPSEETQISLTDPESRSMKTKQGIDVCDNGHIAVDNKYTLIVDHDVTHAVTDLAQLATMAKRAKATLATKQREAVAAMGYDKGDAVKKCLDEGIVPYIPQPNTSANSTLGLFGIEDFRYDATQDCYRCPGDQELPFRFATTEQSRPIRYYSTSVCQTCPLKPKCMRQTENRSMTWWVDETLMEERQQRVATHSAKLKARKGIIEHPLGTMKRWLDHGYFLTRGLLKVQGEMSLTILAYN